MSTNESKLWEVWDEEEEILVEDIELHKENLPQQEIRNHALQGSINSTIIKLKGFLKKRYVNIFVDSRSSKNFIQIEVVELLKLDISLLLYLKSQ